MHIYIHVPFCARRCSYCDFAIAVRRRVPTDDYVDAILREWSLWQVDPAWEESPRVATIYFGGGTPSKLAPEGIARLMDRITADRALGDGAEVTLEANPDDVSEEAATVWRSAGINRISLGVQSFEPEVLRWMHRTHSSDQAQRAIDILRRAGIADLSLDLIFGLPVARDWNADLRLALSFEPEHLSLYGLTLEPHTPLARWTRRGEVALVPDERYAREFLDAHNTLAALGFDHYEVSNAARPGHRAKHNSAYWQRAPFIGLGPAAHSGFGFERRWNVREWAAYQRLIAGGKSPREGRELLDPHAVALEEVYLGLRTSEGLALNRVPSTAAGEWEASGWAAIAADRLRLTPEGWLRLDALVSLLPTSACL